MIKQDIHTKKIAYYIVFVREKHSQLPEFSKGCNLTCSLIEVSSWLLDSSVFEVVIDLPVERKVEKQTVKMSLLYAKNLGRYFLTHFNVKTKVHIVVKICIRITMMVMISVEKFFKGQKKSMFLPKEK